MLQAALAEKRINMRKINVSEGIINGGKKTKAEYCSITEVDRDTRPRLHSVIISSGRVLLCPISTPEV